MAEKITMNSNGKLTVPDNPIIPFIEGDGIGLDIWRATRQVVDAAVDDPTDLSFDTSQRLPPTERCWAGVEVAIPRNELAVSTVRKSAESMVVAPE